MNGTRGAGTTDRDQPRQGCTLAWRGHREFCEFNEFYEFYELIRIYRG